MRFALGLGLLIAAAAPVLAHHSFDAEYWDDKTVTLTGYVTKIDWQNPHAYIYFNTQLPDGSMKEMRFELGPPYALVRGGWKKETVKIGDKITVEGAALAKDPKNNWVGAMQTTSLITATGQKLPTR